MLDADLATLYGVEVKALKQAVRRNADRFPPPEAPPKRRIGFVSEESRAGYQFVELN